MKNVIILQKYIFIILGLFFISCSKKERGFELQKYTICNTQLDSITSLFTLKVHEMEIKNSKEYATLLILNVIDSKKGFSFLNMPIDDVSICIFRYNYRILGYSDKNVILLCNSRINLYDIDNYFDFVLPIDVYKNVSFLYFPSKLYKTRVNDKGKCFLDTFIDDNYLKTFIWNDNKIIEYN